jgi:hypothetical protein
MSTVLHPVDAGLDVLAGVAAALTGSPAGGIVSQVRELLGVPVADSPRSGLNNDGFPVQLSVTVGERGWSSRLLVDPGAYQPDLADRYDTGVAAVRQAATLGHGQALLPSFQQTMAALLPADPAARSAYVDGFVWVGVPLDTPGCALFVDCTRDVPASWARVSAWLETALPEGGHAGALIGRIRGGARLMCAGIEGVEPRVARMKLYWRLAAPGPLAAAGEEFAGQALRRFVATCLDGQPIALDGVVLCAGWSAATGAPTDVKVDLCGHCLSRPGTVWRETVAALAAEQVGADPPEALLTALASGAVDVAYLGLGVARDGGRRLNVYLRPAS